MIVSFFCLILYGSVAWCEMSGDNSPMADDAIAYRRCMLDVIRPLVSNDGSHATSLPRLQIVRKSVVPCGRHITDVARICYVVQGAKAIFHNGKRLVYDSSSLLVLPLCVPLVGEIVDAKPSRPMLSISIALDLEDLANTIRLLPSNQETPSEVGVYCPVRPMNEPLLCALSRYVGLLSEPAAIPALAHGLRRELHYRLLTSPCNADLRAIAARRAEASRIGKALMWFRQHAFEAVPMRKLADRANMSQPAMFKAFKQLTSMSPLQYQKHLRLQEARRLLLAGDGDSSAVSARVGYKSLSQFNREYRRLFEAPPKRDVSNLLAQEMA